MNASHHIFTQKEPLSYSVGRCVLAVERADEEELVDPEGQKDGAGTSSRCLPVDLLFLMSFSCFSFSIGVRGLSPFLQGNYHLPT